MACYRVTFTFIALSVLQLTVLAHKVTLYTGCTFYSFSKHSSLSARKSQLPLYPTPFLYTIQQHMHSHLRTFSLPSVPPPSDTPYDNSISFIKLTTLKMWCASVTFPYPSNQLTTQTLRHPNQSAKEFIKVTQDGDGPCWAGCITDTRCAVVTSKG